MAQAVTGRPGRSAGVLTFLIADVRRYTRFTRERGDAAAASLAKRFADLARDAVEARGGQVIELRGDEALAVFESPAQAVRAGVEFQATCAEESEADPAFPLPVGIGIDSGEAVPVEDGYRGVALNMAARLCANAAAGQVLVTRTVAASAQLTEEIRFVERAAATFKGFEQAVDVIEAVAAAVPQPLPGPGVVVLEAGRGMPPELDPLTPMVGREHEMRWLRGTWRRVRRGRGCVLVVSGPAQIGKTRLAGEIASHVAAGGGLIRYAGPGGVAAAMALSAIEAARAAATPALVVLDDVDLGGPAVTRALLGSFDDCARRPVLVLALLRDPAAAADLAAVIERADEQGDGHRVLAPLDLEGVRGIVRVYVGEDDAVAPVESMARASGGVPGRVHEVVSEWARAEASRRLAAAAEFLAAGRDRHASGLAFANNVIALKLGRLYSVAGRDVRPVETCPYKGLAAFEADDSACFFGREQLVGELAARMVQAGLLGVVGASGSGKSSVITAGLLPSLAAGLLPGSEQWNHALMRPGEHPMAELAAALGSDADDPLAAAARNVPAGGRLVLVVDQFEETFTLGAGEQERAAFVGALTGAAGRWPERVAVIVSLRGDYYAHCAAYPELAGALAANHVLVGPLSPDELRRAIELPARRAGVRVESALTDALVEEVAGEPGGLPLLSTALVELWQAREGGWIRVGAHERTGGVRGAVARLAEASYEQLPGEEREAARRVFLRLVAAGEGGAVTRRRVPVEEFDLGRDAAAAGVLARLTQDRLLTTGEGTVEVAHEALLREWPRLHGWLADDAQGRQLRQQLTQVSRQWQAGGNEPSELYRGARLSAALDWSAGHTADLNELERAFLAASRQASDRDADRQRRANRRLRGLLAGVAALLMLALAAGALALVQRGEARAAQRSAEARRLGARALTEPDLDRALLLAAAAVRTGPSLETEGDLLAVLLRSPHALAQVRGDGGGRLQSLALSPDGRILAAGDNNGRLVFWDTTTMRRIGRPVQVGSYAGGLAFSPDGQRLAVLAHSPDGTRIYVALWDVAHRRLVRRLAQAGGAAGYNLPPQSAAWTPDGKEVAVWSGTGSLNFYDAATGHITRSVTIPGAGPCNIPGGLCNPVDAYAAGRRVLAVPEGTRDAFLVDPGTARIIRKIPLPVLYGPWRLGVSPDGRTLAVGDPKGHVFLEDINTGRVWQAKGGHASGVNSVAFSPDGRTIASTSLDQTAKLWDVKTGQLQLTLTGHSGLVSGAAFAPDGRTLYTSSHDGTVIAWDRTGNRSFAVTRPNLPRGPFTDLVNGSGPAGWSADRRRGVLSFGTGEVVTLNVSTGAVIARGSPVSGPITGLAVSPDGRHAYVTANNDLVYRLNTATNRVDKASSLGSKAIKASVAVSPDGRLLMVCGGSASFLASAPCFFADATTLQRVGPRIEPGFTPGAVAFSPDGRFVALGTFGGRGLRLVEVPSGKVRWANRSIGAVLTIGFSPDGRRIVTGGFNGNIALFDAASGRLLASPTAAHASGITAVSFAPNGQTVLTSGDMGDGTIRLWDAAHLRPLGEALRLLPDQAAYAAYSADGTQILGLDATGRITTWPATVTAWLRRACSIVRRNFTPQERTLYSITALTPPPCP